jgi:DNA-binding XRE family transcriptional regulator
MSPGHGCVVELCITRMSTKEGACMPKYIVCDKLKGLIVQHRFTYKNIEKVIGKSESTIVQKINGLRDFSYPECLLIAKLFDKSVEDVFPEITKHYSKVS